MTISSQSQKPQVFLCFRGKGQRDKIVSVLKSELERSNVNVFMDESEIIGLPKTILFERIKESSVALVFLSDKFSESWWCLNELVVIMETTSLVPFPIFYNVKPESIQNQTGRFRTCLLKAEDQFRKYVDRSSVKSILETEAKIMKWRQALVSVCRNIGFSNRYCNDADFVKKIVDKVQKLLNHISSPRNNRMVIEKPLMHPQEAVTSLLQAQNLTMSNLEDLITKPSIYTDDIISLDTDHLVFVDLISLKNHILIQRFFEPDQVERSLLVLLGSLEYCNEGFAFKPLLLPKKPKKLPGNRVIDSSQEIQDQSYDSAVQISTLVGNISPTAESNDNLQNRPGENNNSDDALSCYSILCNIMKLFSMKIRPPSHRVFISFGEKQLGKTLVSFLKTELESNQISVYVKDQTEGRIKESKVALVVFSGLYPESHQCLDELVEIKKLMDVGEIEPFPIFYNIKAEIVQKIEGWFRYRLFNIEEDFRKSVNRIDAKSVLDTEARIWGWRQAILSIASRPGLSDQYYKSNPLFVSDVVTEVKKKTLMHRVETKAATTTTITYLDNNLFYSLNSFLQALNREITDFEGFSGLPNGLVSLKLKGDTNIVLLKLSSPEKLVQLQRSELYKDLKKGFPFNRSGAIRLGQTSPALALESNYSEQWSN